MEGFDYSKIIWGIVIVAYFVVQWMGRKSAAEQIDDEPQEQHSDVFEFEDDATDPEQPFDRSARDFSRVVRKEQKSTVTTPAPAPAPKRVDVSLKKRFNLRDAVVMSEILNPKFKDK